MQRAVVAIGSRAKKEHQRLQGALREKENHLTKLLADSPESIIVMNDSHRFLAVNQAALMLFGISDKNVTNFTLDAFLRLSQIPCFERSGPPFVRGKERWGECQIRRLDGSVRIVEFTFQANFVPGRHLSKFREVTFHGNTNAEPRDGAQLAYTSESIRHSHVNL
jgi:PAS domain S-box-containing protein